MTEQLKSEYVSREIMEIVAAELMEKSELLQNGIANTHKMLAATVHGNRESFENRFSEIESQVTTTTNQLYELSKTVKLVQESVQSDRASIGQLNTKLVSLEHTLSEFETEVNRLTTYSHEVRKIFHNVTFTQNVTPG